MGPHAVVCTGQDIANVMIMDLEAKAHTQVCTLHDCEHYSCKSIVDMIPRIFKCTPVLPGQELAVYALASNRQLKPLLACRALQTHSVLLDGADALLP